MVRVRYSFGSRHTGRITNIKKQRAKYPDVMKNVIEISDIILEVLDARFIEETRNLDVERDVLQAKKKLVYVFNKCDLVSIRKLEKKLPRWMRPYVFVSATKGIGLKDLKARVKIESKRILSERKSTGINEEKKKEIVGEKRSEHWGRVHVGVIGVPNAGKSSVINFITRKGVAKVGAKAGFTKGMQKIRMSDGILILDTPGVIPADRYTTEKKGFARDVKIGARSYSDVRNPERAVTFLMTFPVPKDKKNLTDEERDLEKEAESNAKVIEKFYGIVASRDDESQKLGSRRKGEGADVEIFIEKLGRMKGFLGKGGKIDEDRAARLILRDWQEGKIVSRLVGGK
jgi:ribosome biogenesis GTPase A